MFQVDLDKLRNFLWYAVMERHLSPRCLPFDRAGGDVPALRRPKTCLILFTRGGCTTPHLLFAWARRLLFFV